MRTYLKYDPDKERIILNIFRLIKDGKTLDILSYTDMRVKNIKSKHVIIHNRIDDTILLLHYETYYKKSKRMVRRTDYSGGNTTWLSENNDFKFRSLISYSAGYDWPGPQFSQLK